MVRPMLCVAFAFRSRFSATASARRSAPRCLCAAQWRAPEMKRLPSRTAPRRGAAIVAMITTMLLLGLIGVGMVLGGARDQDLSIKRLETVRAFYAAESGMNMAIRELMVRADEDGDGAIGSISDDG